jgi:hypothetical protein
MQMHAMTPIQGSHPGHADVVPISVFLSGRRKKMNNSMQGACAWTSVFFRTMQINLEP